MYGLGDHIHLEIHLVIVPPPFGGLRERSVPSVGSVLLALSNTRTFDFGIRGDLAVIASALR